MPMIKCPECARDVSDSARQCPGCGVQIRKPKRTFLGKLMKFLFIAFNLLMILWLISYFVSVGELSSAAGSDAERTGLALGATMGTGMLLVLWALGDVVLGLLVLLTRPK